MNRKPGPIFIAGIDTGIGKTVACGMIARFLRQRGESVITQKLVQTGCRGLSSDIRLHRRLMNMSLTKEDRTGLTCPYVFRFAASPHLAAARENARIDPRRIRAATRRLASVYDRILIEGVGGVDVPLRVNFSTLDYLASEGFPVIVVSSSRLGSINHTRLTLRAIRERNMEVLGIVYNRHHGENKTIARDTRRLLLRALKSLGFAPVIVDLPPIPDMNRPTAIDFSPLLPPVHH